MKRMINPATNASPFLPTKNVQNIQSGGTPLQTPINKTNKTPVNVFCIQHIHMYSDPQKRSGSNLCQNFEEHYRPVAAKKKQKTREDVETCAHVHAPQSLPESGGTGIAYCVGV
jgi:hypothetical protein